MTVNESNKRKKNNKSLKKKIHIRRGCTFHHGDVYAVWNVVCIALKKKSKSKKTASIILTVYCYKTAYDEEKAYMP